MGSSCWGAPQPPTGELRSSPVGSWGAPKSGAPQLPTEELRSSSMSCWGAPQQPTRELPSSLVGASSFRGARRRFAKYKLKIFVSFHRGLDSVSGALVGRNRRLRTNSTPKRMQISLSGATNCAEEENVLNFSSVGGVGQSGHYPKTTPEGWLPWGGCRFFRLHLGTECTKSPVPGLPCCYCRA